MNAPAGTVLRLLATSGTISVVVCPLCAALLVADGEQQHGLVHRAALLRDSEDDRPTDGA